MKKGINISVKNGRRVVEGLGYYKPREVKELRELVRGSAAKYGDAMGFRFKDNEGNITGKTYLEFEKDIDSLGTELHSMGLKNARIAIISENRYEWGVCFFSIVNGTGVAVPLDKYLPQNEVENLIQRGKVDAIFYSPTYHEMMLKISETNNLLKYYICIAETEDTVSNDGRFFSMPGLIKAGREKLERGDRAFVDAVIDKDVMSVLLFTSGTTSMAKGVMLSHTNLAVDITAITTIIHAGPGDVHLSLLPLHHTFENTIGLMFMVHSGVCIAYCEGIKHIARNIQEYGVTILVAVPAILEAMYKKVQEGIVKSGKERVFKLLTGVSEALRLIGIDVRKQLFRSVFEKLGPRLRIAVSGAAPLDPEIVIGFEKMGLRLIQGYGLTETSPVVAANNDFINKPGTIGYPLAGIEVAIDAPDENGMGEIITRGGNVMLGYYEDEASTAECIDAEGWFRTGDLGSIDENGFIRITGRAKSMIVLTNGKKAFPEEYEVLLNNIPGVKESFVWGNKALDGDIQVCAELVIDRDKALEAYGQGLSDKELGAKFDAAIREINKNIPQYKIIRYFVMSDTDLIKTTTLKIKRPLEYERVTGLLKNAGLDIRKASGRFLESL